MPSARRQDPKQIRRYSTDLVQYTEIQPVFDRIQTVASPSVVKKIKAIFLFDIEGEGKWHVDLKNGNGAVGQGAPSEGKPDVMVTIKKEIFLQIFNRELKPATAFMNGQIKFSGDMTKALALESVMKATR